MNVVKYSIYGIGGIIGALAVVDKLMDLYNKVPKEELILTTRNVPCNINGACQCIEEFCETKNYNKIKKRIESARSSICLCIYRLSHKNITDDLIIAKLMGVDVRVICDFEQYFLVRGSSIQRLIDKGITVVWPSMDTGIMHSKFCVIDGDLEDGTFISGSANWTNEALGANVENMMITSEPKIVKEFYKEFKELTKACTNEQLRPKPASTKYF